MPARTPPTSAAGPRHAHTLPHPRPPATAMAAAVRWTAVSSLSLSPAMDDPLPRPRKALSLSPPPPAFPPSPTDNGRSVAATARGLLSPSTAYKQHALTGCNGRSLHRTRPPPHGRSSSWMQPHVAAACITHAPDTSAARARQGQDRAASPTHRPPPHGRIITSAAPAHAPHGRSLSRGHLHDARGPRCLSCA
jgi:hypothetical protein